MEEDIKILENILKTKEYGLCEITDTFYKAIENLLKVYKEKEREILGLEDEIQEQAKNLMECEDVIKGYLNKIEELEQEITVLQNTKDTCPNYPTSGIKCELKTDALEEK